MKLNDRIGSTTRLNYAVLIKSSRAVGGAYMSYRMANTPEMAVSMIKLEADEEILDVFVRVDNSEWAHE